MFSAYSLYTLAEPSVWTTVAALLLGVGFSLSPVAHVAYYYVGTLCKNLFDEHRRWGTVSEAGQGLVNEYVRFLDITWMAAVGITALGWVVYTFLREKVQALRIRIINTHIKMKRHSISGEIQFCYALFVSIAHERDSIEKSQLKEKRNYIIDMLRRSSEQESLVLSYIQKAIHVLRLTCAWIVFFS